jgi:hypothetical protein
MIGGAPYKYDHIPLEILWKYRVQNVPFGDRELTIQESKEVRRVLNYLETRPDIADISKDLLKSRQGVFATLMHLPRDYS